MKEIIVISGKGGTGKTSISAAFAQLAGDRIILADCDVDAADMHLLMQPDYEESKSFCSGNEAIINENICVGCGECQKVCRFDAIIPNDDVFQVDPLSCEGCGYCMKVCPSEAIKMIQPHTGFVYQSNIKTGTRMAHARLNIGADNSGKLVTGVKSLARDLAEKYHKEIIVVDGSPGIGCPVVASLAGASLVVLVTEPSVSAYHDLDRVVKLIQKFNLRASCILNKSDLNPDLSEEIKLYLQQNQIELITEIPFDPEFSKAISQGKTIVELTNSEHTERLKEAWEQIITQL